MPLNMYGMNAIPALAPAMAGILPSGSPMAQGRPIASLSRQTTADSRPDGVVHHGHHRRRGAQGKPKARHWRDTGARSGEGEKHHRAVGSSPARRTKTIGKALRAARPRRHVLVAGTIRHNATAARVA